mmetsp:Transcript_11512/g.15533  ORF Transcript_11512/g.15533 Transcript_11512/m.15533 type:complete len:252 (+) Transcript_11512:804-1559(+)
MLLEDFDDLAVGHHVVQSLDAVKDVKGAMVGVVLEVAHLKLTREVHECLQRNVELVEEVLLIEEFEAEELEGVLLQHGLKAKCIEGDLVQVLRCLLIQLVYQLDLVDHLKEFHLEWINLRQHSLLIHAAHSATLAKNSFLLVHLSLLAYELVFLSLFLLFLLVLVDDLDAAEALLLTLVDRDVFQSDDVGPGFHLRALLLKFVALNVGRVEFVLRDELVGPLKIFLKLLRDGRVGGLSLQEVKDALNIARD